MPSPCTVTGNLQALTSGQISFGRIIFQLTNIGTGNPIGIVGTSLFPSLRLAVESAQDGSFSIAIWGNDNINPANTLYSVTYRDSQGNEMGPVLYSITGASVNLNSLSASSGTVPPVLLNGAVLLNPTTPQTITGQSLILSSSAALILQGGLTATAGQNIANFYNLNTVRSIDGTKFSKTGAGINAAVADIGSGTPGVITVPSAGDYSDTVITLGKYHTLLWGAGAFTSAGINVPDSTSAGHGATADGTGVCAIVGISPELTIINLKNTANRDVITDTNFGTLTGGTNFNGVFRTRISNLTVDGNKANNTSGFGIRLYGRGYTIDNVVIQNAKQDGLWLEWGGTEEDIIPIDDIESTVANVKTIYNGGNGFTHKGPNDITVSVFESYGNGAWGIDEFFSAHWLHVNCYENVSGGIKLEAICPGVDGVDVAANTATGWGMLCVAGGGGSNFSASSWGGPIALEVNTSANTFVGQFSNFTTAGIKFNNAGANSNVIIGTTVLGAGPLFMFTLGGTGNNILLTGSTADVSSLNSGAIPQANNIFVYVTRNAGNLILNQVATAALNIGGGVLTLPSGVTDTIVARATTDTLQNKTLVGPVSDKLTLTAAAPTVAAAQVGLGSTTATTVGAAGGASALPATPTGYLIVNVAGTNFKIPYYAS